MRLISADRVPRLVLALCFFADGLLLGSWASRVPAVQDHAGLTNPQLGVALFASALGAMTAMPVAGRLCDRKGSRRVLVVALPATAAALLLMSLATGLTQLALALFAFGAGFGAINVAANAQGLALERRRGRRILSSLHAAFSAGGLAGAGLGGLAAAVSVGPQTHFALVGLVLVGVTAVAAPTMLPEAGGGAGSRPTTRISWALLLLGLAAFCCMLAEGAVADWSAVYLARSAGAGAGLAALGYSAFALAMTISRLTGDRLSERLAPSALVGGGGALAAAGLGGALAIGSAAAGLVGFVAMGAGLGVVIPVLFRAAGTAPGATAGVGVATVSTIGWLGFLAGPAAIGFAAGLVGLRSALTIVVGTSIVLAALGRLIRSSPPVAFEPRAVLSDLDGVLVDSTGSTTRAWRSFAERNGLDPEVILAEMHGRRSEDLVRLVAPGLDAPREAADVERRQTDDSDDVRALPGARELIAAIPPDRFAIVTSCPEPLARARLRAAGLPVPAVLITSERVGAGKPDPEGYVNAARTLGVDPAHCLVLEDAPVGVAAGLAAGMTVFAVVTTHAEADLHAAHRRVADLCVLLPFSVRSTAEDGAPLLN